MNRCLLFVWPNILFLLTISLNGRVAMAQEKPKPAPVNIQLKDGREFQGTLIESKRDTLQVARQSDTLRIAFKDVRRIDYESTKRRERDWDESPNITRYFFTNTAFSLEEGDVVYHNTYLVLNGVQAGITDRIMIGGGGDIFGGSLFYLNAKVNILQKPRYKFSTGINYFRLPEDVIETVSGADIRNIGMVYGAGTWGNTNHNFTISAGYIFLKTEPLPPIITVSGSTRLLKRLALVSENWFLFIGEDLKTPVLISGGLRFIADEWTLDLSLFTDHQFSDNIFLPFIAYSRKLDW